MKRLVLGAATAALFAPSAFGQVFELTEKCDAKQNSCQNLDDIIAVGTRIGTSTLSELTSAASFIKEADIDARNQNNITDILRSLPGVAVNISGPSSNLSQVRVRGNEANQVLVLIDGIEVNNPLTGEFDFGGIQTANVSRIEILRGEQSALWGADAIGGVINIITKNGNTQEQIHASIEGGSFNTIEGQISAVVPFGDAALSINGNVFSSDNYDISGNDGEDDSSESRSLDIGVTNINIGAMTFGAKAGLSRIDSNFEAQVNGRLQDTLADKSSRKIDSFRVNTTFEFLGFQNLVTATSHKEKNDSRFTAVDFSFVTFLEEIAIDPISGRNLTSLLDTTGKRQNLNWAAKKSWDAHNITLLGELENESFVQSSKNKNSLETRRASNTESQAIALDYNYNSDSLTLTGSVRQDFNSLFEDTLTWRIGAGYDLARIGLGRVRASLGTGIKNPTLTEVFGILSSNTFEGNSELKPEKSFGYNIGYTQNFFNETVAISVDYFNSELKNEIFNEFNTPPTPDRANNRDLKSTRKGVELELKANVSKQLSLRSTATFLDAEFISSFPLEIQKAPRRPDLIASTTLQWSPTENFVLTGSFDYTGEQLDTNFGNFSTVELDAFTLIGLNAAYNLNDHFTLTLRGDNLLDEDYQEVFGYASPGRAVYGGLKANF